MKKYELQYTKGEDGVFRMSTVENPAVKSQLVMFSEELELLTFADDEKQVIYSVAMRPNMLIPRKNINGEPAMVFYTEETAEDLLQNFFKNGSNLGATVNHDNKVRSDMYIFEAWKVLDPERDKGTVMGLQINKGDIVMGQKIDNPEVWADVKSGKLKGLSFEGYLEPVLTNKEIQMTQEEVDKRVKKILMEQNSTAYKVGEKEYFIDKLEAGGKVQDVDGNPIPNAEIEVEKWKIKTDADGVITEAIKEIENEEDPPAGEKDDVTKIKEENEALKTENNDLKAKITELESKQTNMSTELAETKKVVVAMSAEAQKGIKPNGESAKTYAEMSGYERLQFNKQNKR